MVARFFRFTLSPSRDLVARFFCGGVFVFFFFCFFFDPKDHFHPVRSNSRLGFGAGPSSIFPLTLWVHF